MKARGSQEREGVPQLRTEAGAGLLRPSLPRDIAARTQRERILLAMTESCAAKSFAATTIADIVGRASISRATFYKHFTGKRECFDAAVDRFLAELCAAVEEAGAESGGTGVLAVRETIAAMLTRLAASPAHARLLLVEAPSVDPQVVGRCRGLATEALRKHLRTAGVANSAAADPDIAFGRALVLVAEYLAADEAERLPALLPELLYIALLPHIGHVSALEQASIAR